MKKWLLHANLPRLLSFCRVLLALNLSLCALSPPAGGNYRQPNQPRCGREGYEYALRGRD